VSGHHLAQFNFARLVAPLEDPRIDGFRLELDRINALAEAQPGFVWRMVGEGDTATDIRAFDDDLVLVNASVWQSAEHLAAFVFRSEHRAFLRQRRDWFEAIDEAYLVLWWVAAGHRPDLVECLERLSALQQCGATPHAFDFRTRFPAPQPETLP
jgi:hypothetical protein